MLHAPLFGRPVPPPPPIGERPPFTPSSYLALRRKAAGLTIDQVAELIVAQASRHALRSRQIGRAAQIADLRTLLRQLETPGIVARLRATIDILAGTFPFDPDVYFQLATTPADRHPRICRGCGCTQEDACTGGCRWAGQEICTRCSNGELF